MKAMENEKFQNLVLEHLVRLTQDLTEFKIETNNHFNTIDSHFGEVDLRLDKVDSRFSEMDSRFDKVDSRFSEMDSRLERIEVSVIRIENDHGEKLRALFDAREVQMDINERICDTLNRIEGKIDRLGLKVSAHDALLKKAK
jgi:septation ring formation regulator EzrA